MGYDREAREPGRHAGDIADLVAARGFKPPAITVVGEVVKLRSELNWYEALPLFGQRVVITRTRTQASGLKKG